MVILVDLFSRLKCSRRRLIVVVDRFHISHIESAPDIVVTGKGQLRWRACEHGAAIPSAIPEEHTGMWSIVRGLRLCPCAGREDQERQNDWGCERKPAHEQPEGLASFNE